MIQPPTITSFTPTSGPVGTIITVTGTNLSGATAARVNGTAGTITANTATSLTFTVAAGSTTGAVGATATRTNPADIKAYLDAIRPKLDIDGEGHVNALTDGIMILRYMFGLRGATLTQGAVELGAPNTQSQIESILGALMQ